MREISVEEYNMDTGDQREPSPNILALWKLIQSLLKSAPSSKKPLLTPPSMGRGGGICPSSEVPSSVPSVLC